MVVSPSADELARLEALARYAVLDPLPDTAFGRLAQLAAQFFRVPVALVNIVTEDSSWSKACVGVDLRRMDRQLSFCARTIEQSGVLVSLDLAHDSRFTHHPLVGGAGGFRFYAGAPLQTPDGYNVGTLCVLDRVPRAAVTQAEREALTNLAALAVDELELHRARLEAEREADTRQRLVDDLRRTSAHAETLAAVSALADLDLDPATLVMAAAPLLARVSPLDWAGLVRQEGGRLTVETAWRPPGQEGSPAPVPDLVLRKAVGERLGRAPVPGAPVFLAGPAVPAGVPGAPEAVGGLVLAPLGPLHGAPCLLAAARLTARPWSQADRELFGVASRTVAGALLRQEREGRMWREARHDPLTGLGNRRALDDVLAASGAPRALALLDLDGFKGVNDREGHARGDVLLRLFAGALAAELPPGGSLYRLGGDEFVLLLGGVSDPEEARAAVLEGVDAAVAAARAAGFREVGASFGVALWPDEGRDPQATLRLADERMYEDKRRRATARARRESPGDGSTALP